MFTRFSGSQSHWSIVICSTVLQGLHSVGTVNEGLELLQIHELEELFLGKFSKPYMLQNGHHIHLVDLVPMGPGKNKL